MFDHTHIDLDILAFQFQAGRFAENLSEVAHGTNVTAEHGADRNHAQLHDLLLKIQGMALHLFVRFPGLFAGAAAVLQELTQAALGDGDLAGEIEHAVKFCHVDSDRVVFFRPWLALMRRRRIALLSALFGWKWIVAGRLAVVGVASSNWTSNVACSGVNCSSPLMAAGISCRTASTALSSNVTRSRVTGIARLRKRCRSSSKAWAKAVTWENPRLAELPLMVWAPRNMASRSRSSVGLLSKATSASSIRTRCSSDSAI